MEGVRPNILGRVHFENVSFAYPQREGFVLKSFSLNVKAGETVALVGASGSGKSTTGSLLMRFYDPQSGRVRFVVCKLGK